MTTWEEVAAKLPVEKTAEQKEHRRQLFAGFDPNGNGYVSLAECDKGCRDVLGLDDENSLPKPVIMRAYQAARSVAQADGKNLTKHGGDYIEWAEFRLFLVYLRRYLELWYMFAGMDVDADRRLSFVEFETALPTLAGWGVAVDDPQSQFDEIDSNGGGMILFDEFAQWAMEVSLPGVTADT
jgi:Ca2+-binding EF-hand superfamily protein